MLVVVTIVGLQAKVLPDGLAAADLAVLYKPAMTKKIMNQKM